MSIEQEKFSLEEAQNEASRMKEKINSGEALDYAQAMDLLEHGTKITENIESGKDFNVGSKEPDGEMTKEEIEFRDRMQSEIGSIGKSLTSFELDFDRKDSEKFLAKNEQHNEQLLEQLLEESGISKEWLARLLQTNSEELKNARDSADRTFQNQAAYYDHPVLIPFGYNDFEDCKDQKDTVRLAMQKLEGIGLFLKYVGRTIRIIDCAIGIKKERGEFKIEETKPAEEEILTFDSLTDHYSDYFDDQGKVKPPDWSSRPFVDSEAFAENYNKWWPGLGQERLSRVFSGKKVIDLGCGGSDAMTMARCVIGVGAKAYIGVDKFNNPQNVNDYGRENNLPCIAVMDDLLTFLEKEPDNSAVIVANGLDEFVFNLRNPSTVSYMEKLASEISRVSGPNEIVGIESFPIFSQLKKLGYSSSWFSYSSEFTSIESFSRLNVPKPNKLLKDLFSDVIKNPDEASE